MKKLIVALLIGVALFFVGKYAKPIGDKATESFEKMVDDLIEILDKIEEHQA